MVKPVEEFPDGCDDILKKPQDLFKHAKPQAPIKKRKLITTIVAPEGKSKI